MKKFAIAAIIFIMVIAAYPVFAPTYEGWIEEYCIPRCVAIVTMRGLGTGIIATEEGYILTNRHVVQDAGAITVYLSDYRTTGARIVGYHSETDIAVIKVETDKPLLAWDAEKMVANPRMIFMGQEVYALGHPWGLAWSVSRGIISNRWKVGSGEVFWQTDASINMGNSGGPLFDENCKLIGINSMAYPPSWVENIAFAIAVHTFIDEARMIIEADIRRMGIINDIWKYLDEEGKFFKYYENVFKDNR